MRRLLVLGGVAAVLGLTLAAAPASAQNKKVKRDRYVLTQEEMLEHSDIATAYEAVQRLRPHFLKVTRSRGTLGSASMGSDPYSPPKPSKQGSASGGGGASGEPTTSTSGGGEPRGMSGSETSNAGPVLYIDDVEQQDLEEMKNVRVPDLMEIRYMQGTEASGRYGSGHEGGAILVKTNRGK
ncbi:MAG: hypothetical protein ABI647_08110 [Gemmatimonadota bacterium]